MSNAMETFPSGLAKKTGFNWKRGIELFVEFYGKNVDEILAERKDDLTSKPNEFFNAQNRLRKRGEMQVDTLKAKLLNRSSFHTSYINH